jgi:NADPH2:quinone reductase
MSKAIRIHANGGPEVLIWEDVEVPEPGRGEALVRHTCIGVNYADINLRRGTFYRANFNAVKLPAILGNEGVGVVEGIGPGVTEVAVGDRVAYICPSGSSASPGGYSEKRVIAAARLARIPDNVTDQQAAGSFIKGLTAWAIVRRTFLVKTGDVVLVHAAAGGVASFLTQWSKYLGAEVIGTVGSVDKAATAKANGCDHTILYRETDFVKEVRRLYPEGISAVFDGVGKDVFIPSLDCLKYFGMLVNFGNASGAPPPVDVRSLSDKGSLIVTRIGMGNFIEKRPDLVAASAEMFGLVSSGVLKVSIDRTYPLRDAAQAHRDIEDRKTSGSVVLIP